MKTQAERGLGLGLTALIAALVCGRRDASDITRGTDVLDYGPGDGHGPGDDVGLRRGEHVDHLGRWTAKGPGDAEPGRLPGRLFRGPGASRPARSRW